jgi:hypothetical protein
MRRATVALILLLAVAGACARLLGFHDRPERPFPHRAHVLEGVRCLDCHQGIEEAGPDAPLNFPDTETCIGCHETPHDPRPCGQCHGDALVAASAAADRENLRFSHRDHLSVVDGNCVRCHVGVGASDKTLRAPMAACLRCHDHDEEFRTRDCDACHTELAAELTRPRSHLVHGDDFIRDHPVLAASSQQVCETCHAERFCADCHGASGVVPALPAARAFDQVSGMNLHRANFMARHAEEARGDPGLCSSCHMSPESFCLTCHIDSGVAGSPGQAVSPHPPGWVGPTSSRNDHGRAARLDPASCASCHGGAGEALCVECHQVGGIGGNPHPPGFSSGRGLHELPCRLCHTGGI